MSEPTYRTIDMFDRLLGALADLPDVIAGKPSTVTKFSPLVGAAQTFIVQTFRRREEGDYIMLQYLDGDRSYRLALLPAVADAIARQRDALTTKSRKRAGKEQAEQRKARGEVLGFMRNKKVAADKDDEAK
jgi:hypothetical protein